MSGNFSHNSLFLLLSFIWELLDWVCKCFSSDEKVSLQSGTKEYHKVTPETKLTQEIYWEGKDQKGGCLAVSLCKSGTGSIYQGSQSALWVEPGSCKYSGEEPGHS